MRSTRTVTLLSAWALLLAGCAYISGCAYIGDPKPPALERPVRILNLRAAEYGANVITEFTLPATTTEGLPVKDVMQIEMRVTAGAVSKTLPIPPQDPGPVKFDFPVKDWTGQEIALAVRAIGRKGKPSDWSNSVTLPVTAPLETPTQLRAVASGEGVKLTWSSAGKHFWIFRAKADAPSGMPPARLADADANTYTDATAEFGMPYKYFVQANDGAAHQSEISETVSITPVDTFPPAVPKGLSAVAANDAIELAWERNTESDFAGYNIYRSANAGAFVKITERVESPNYSDRAVTAGTKYSYAITSVDQSGNESERTAPVEVRAQ